MQARFPTSHYNAPFDAICHNRTKTRLLKKLSPAVPYRVLWPSNLACFIATTATDSGNYPYRASKRVARIAKTLAFAGFNEAQNDVDGH